MVFTEADPFVYLLEIKNAKQFPTIFNNNYDMTGLYLSIAELKAWG